MQGKQFYEYAVIRLVPKVEREEFLNVGVLLFSKQAKFLKVLCRIEKQKFEIFTCELEFEDIEKNLQAIEKIVSGDKNGGPIAQWELADRFRWLTAQRSSSIQTSRPHNGFSENLDATLKRLFEELVL
ncbi:DUF3037 domain-containing protein [Aequorivita echinoideorum]|uniref:DUF3037 domain-containing protein n=1 Tax=Aequorivita echinoideorum TaxID=1549647 RepID=A0ABS5S6I2_9FLAO|nr:DUF3037 domain-containing protein [Aequorivita echinoideorum]MBT0608812.1 DUF3037 domain-containing protein [Aequorivita echinoideorum]